MDGGRRPRRLSGRVRGRLAVSAADIAPRPRARESRRPGRPRVRVEHRGRDRGLARRRLRAPSPSLGDGDLGLRDAPALGAGARGPGRLPRPARKDARAMVASARAGRGEYRARLDDRSDGRLAAQPDRRRAREPVEGLAQPRPRVAAGPAAAHVLAGRRRRVERRDDDDERRPRLRRERKDRRQHAHRRPHAGHGRTDRGRAPRAAAPRARHRVGHRLDGRLARRGPFDRARGRRGAGAGDPPRGARSARPSTETCSRTPRCASRSATRASTC